LERIEKEIKENELLGFKKLFFEALSLWSRNLFQIFIIYIIPVIILRLLLGILYDVQLFGIFLALVNAKAPVFLVVKSAVAQRLLSYVILPAAMSLFWVTLIFYFHNVINNGEKKWRESFILAIPIFPRLALWTIITSLIEEIGLIFLIIPGVYLMIRYVFVDYVVVLEKDVSNPLRKSWELTKGFGWHIIGYLIFLSLIYVASAIPLYILIAIFGNPLVLRIIEKAWLHLFAILCGIFFLQFYLNLKRFKTIT